MESIIAKNRKEEIWRLLSNLPITVGEAFRPKTIKDSWRMCGFSPFVPVVILSMCSLWDIGKFTVDQNGNVTNAKIHKTSGHPSIDKLLLDAIIAMPKWTPAQNPKGKNVGQEMLFPLYICGR